jgi:hypothetical protein
MALFCCVKYTVSSEDSIRVVYLQKMCRVLASRRMNALYSCVQHGVLLIKLNLRVYVTFTGTHHILRPFLGQ